MFLLLSFVNASLYLEVPSCKAFKTETLTVLLFLLLVYAEQRGVVEMEQSVMEEFLKVNAEDVLSGYMKFCTFSSSVLLSILFSCQQMSAFFFLNATVCVFKCLCQAVLESSAYYEI